MPETNRKRGPWRATWHHHGLYTFDWCDLDECDDPTHFVDEESHEYVVACEESRAREAARVAARMGEVPPPQQSK